MLFSTVLDGMEVARVRYYSELVGGQGTAGESNGKKNNVQIAVELYGREHREHDANGDARSQCEVGRANQWLACQEGRSREAVVGDVG